jgi:hypothetical protein
MPPEAAAGSSGSASSFAKLFAGLARLKSSDAGHQLGRWDDETLAEDVATISYEQALRAHARYRRTEPLANVPVETSDPAPPKPLQPMRITEWVPNDTSETLAATRKLSSITIRMSRSECKQLRVRAAAAGMTVSAYLRSCIFEVETLRSQVKDALSELQSQAAPSGAEQVADRNKIAFPGNWRTRFLAPWSRKCDGVDA